ncbi:alkaline phosphatase [Elysia marginata]|uniref:alkaline phosphatase n=1 Tax=Elysia marginata TaxID=1093978 RepID=A0AAV4HIS1_9GAST|nr:alkaline phosphatase [Elysia marginata]
MDNSNEDSWYAPTDGRVLTTLHYANGPGPSRSLNLADVDTSDLNFKFPVAVPIAYETHGGEDVSIYAQGPMAHLLTGNWEQNYIAHVMAYAACVGRDKSHCTQQGREDADFCSNRGMARAGRQGKTSGAILVVMATVAVTRYCLLLLL